MISAQEQLIPNQPAQSIQLLIGISLKSDYPQNSSGQKLQKPETELFLIIKSLVKTH